MQTKYFIGNTYITFKCNEGLFRTVNYFNRPTSLETLQKQIDTNGFRVFFKFTNTKVIKLQKANWLNRLIYGKAVLYCIKANYK